MALAKETISVNVSVIVTGHFFERKTAAVSSEMLGEWVLLYECSVHRHGGVIMAGLRQRLYLGVKRHGVDTGVSRCSRESYVHTKLASIHREDVCVSL